MKYYTVRIGNQRQLKTKMKTRRDPIITVLSQLCAIAFCEAILTVWVSNCCETEGMSLPRISPPVTSNNKMLPSDKYARKNNRDTGKRKVEEDSKQSVK